MQFDLKDFNNNELDDPVISVEVGDIFTSQVPRIAEVWVAVGKQGNNIIFLGINQRGNGANRRGDIVSCSVQSSQNVKTIARNKVGTADLTTLVIPTVNG